MHRTTTLRRLVLAVLVAATAPSLLYGLLSIGPVPDTRLNQDGYVVALDGFDRIVYGVSSVFLPLAIGGPLCLGLILFFLPLWALHHRLRGGLVSFLLAASLVGAVPAGFILWFGVAVLSSLAKHPMEGGPVMIAVGAACGGLFSSLLGLILWFVAYGGRPLRRAD